MGSAGMPYGLQAMLKEGYSHVSGMSEAVFRNLEACKELSKITRTSMGPNGMNKIVINHLDKTFVTSDATVMVNELEVEHPAAKLVVMAAKAQENEIGDGTNLVLTLAGELLDKAQGLLKEGLTTTEVADGYMKATVKALELVEGAVIPGSENINLHDQGSPIANRLVCPLAAKQFGYEDVLAPLIAKACVMVCPKNPVNFNVDNVRTVKIPGSVISESTVVSGMVLRRGVEGSITKVTDCKVAVYAQGFDTSGTETKGTVLIHSAAELETYAKTEEGRMEQIVKAVAAAGVRAIFSGAAVGEMAMHFLEKYGIMVVRVPSKFDLRRICRATGGAALVKVEAPGAEEVGHATEISLQELGGTKCVVLHGGEAGAVATIALRGSTEALLADVERAVDDGVNCFKALTKDARAVAAGGGLEVAVARSLRDFGQRQAGLQQYSICAFADALEAIPRTLAENSGLDAQVCMRKLNAAHAAGETFAGLDVETGDAKDLQEDNLTDLMLTKWWAIKLTGDVVSTVLRVDQIIMAKPAGGPKPPQARGNWDEE